MTLRHRADADFWALYQALPTAVQRRADKAFQLLKQDLQHPSVQFKKVGTKWSARVDRGYRAPAISTDDGFLWFWIGTRDDDMRENHK